MIACLIHVGDQVLIDNLIVFFTGHFECIIQCLFIVFIEKGILVDKKIEKIENYFKTIYINKKD